MSKGIIATIGVVGALLIGIFLLFKSVENNKDNSIKDENTFVVSEVGAEMSQDNFNESDSEIENELKNIDNGDDLELSEDLE